MIAPNSTIKILRLPIALSEENQILFENAIAQTTYFESLEQIELEDYTYLRTESTIYVEGKADELIYYNYIMYQNTSYTNKWYYAYITNIGYENDNTVAISIKLDVFQTFMFDFNFKPSFIEREHVANDSIGLHTYPENVETGDPIINDVYTDPELDNFLNDTCYVVGTTMKPNAVITEFEYTGGAVYNGLYSGVKYYKFDYMIKENINSFLQRYAEAGRSDAITGLFIAPQILCPGTNYSPEPILESDEPISYNISFSKNRNLNGYTPKNNKLYCYPFAYCIANNMGGNTNIIRYEEFSSDDCEFRVDGVLTPGCSIRLIPLNYKGISENNLEVLTLGKYPICNYSVDMYTNWLTQNSVNIAGTTYTSDELNMSQTNMNGIINAIGSLITGDVGNLISGGFNTGYQIANNMIAQKQHSLIPPSVRGNENCGDVNASSSNLNFKFFQMSIKKEYAQKIDNFFSMYGYLVNDLKIPNINSRTNWNYLKTTGCNLYGAIPDLYIEELSTLFNNGITIWHTTTYFLDYSKSNSIRS